MFFWVIFVIIIPNLSSYVATALQPVSSEEKFDAKIKGVWDEFQAEQRKSWEEQGPRNATQSDASGPLGYFHKCATRNLMDFKRKQNSYFEPLRARYATRAWRIRQDYFIQLKQQKDLADHLSFISPVAVYENLIFKLSGTDSRNFENFVKQAERYREEFIDYLHLKTEGFSSLSYFTVATEEEIDKYTESIEKTGGTPEWVHQKNREDYPPLDMRDSPHFTYKPGGMGTIFEESFPNIFILLIMNVVFFILSFVFFLRYDVT